MPRISKEKRDKVSEQVLHYLFSVSPNPKFTTDIAKEIARDEEFIKMLLLEMQEKKLVISINKNPKGIEYTKRQRWRLSNEAFDVYSKHQSNNNNLYNSLALTE